MSETIASQAAEENNADNVKEPRLAWMIGFLFLVSFVGLFALVPLSKVPVNCDRTSFFFTDLLNNIRLFWPQ